MKAGKLSESAMKRSVWKQLHTSGATFCPDILAGPSVGADYAALKASDEEIILSVHPVLLAHQDIGKLGVWKALNNVACAGAKPVGVLVSVLAPTLMNEPQLRDLIKELADTCAEAGVRVLGGHTEVTRAVKEPLVTVTGVGKVPAGRRIPSGSIEPGMDILVSKWIGLEGTAILAKEREEELRSRYSQPFLDQAKKFDAYLPVLTEAAVAAESGVGSMHDVSEGGIFGALWEFAQGSGVGLEIDLKKIPIRQETVEICEFFDLNPYKLLSGGCLLMAARDGNAIVREIEKTGGRAAIIGKATDSNDRIIRNEEEQRFLETTQTDELYKITG